MNERLGEALDVLGDYDTTVARTLVLLDYLQEDHECDDDTMTLGEGLLIAVLLDKASPLTPVTEEDQAQVMAQAQGLPELLESIGEHIPLLCQVAIGYAVLLSRSRNGWRPWERFRDTMLGKVEE